MPATISPQDFVAKWRSSNLRENAAYVEHFIDLCKFIGHPTPASVDLLASRVPNRIGCGSHTRSSITLCWTLMDGRTTSPMKIF
jgi:hypothetical protein